MAAPSTSQGGTSEDAPLTALLDRVTKAEEYKLRGNELYNSRDIQGAIGKYHRALLYVRGIEANLQKSSLLAQMGLALGGSPGPMDGAEGSGSASLPEDVRKKVSAIEQGCLNNLAACILLKKEPNYEKVVYYCNRVLDVTPDNAKALYRKGCALYHLASYEEAIAFLKKAQQISHSDPNIQKFLTLSKEKLTTVEKSQRSMYQDMFKQKPTQSDS